jgi:hypothetical protein
MLSASFCSDAEGFLRRRRRTMPIRIAIWSAMMGSIIGGLQKQNTLERN